ncbi:MAG: hypothetical protein QOK20_881 [Acidimicrobiaceae bacterium]|nr:hypothetical protein [Acidimicrobiaceae bacterium]
MATNEEPHMVSDVPTIDPRGDLLWERSPGVNEPGGLVPPYSKPHDESLADPPAAGNDDVHMVKDGDVIDPRGDLLWERSPGLNEPGGLVPPYEKPRHEPEPEPEHDG